MTSSLPPSGPHVGRFTALILGFVVFVCVTMIGGTSYLKYQLDRAQTLLAAPDAALGSDQEMFDRLRRDLGYGGFLGLLQNYVLLHDASGFPEMKAHIKSADDIVAHLPDKTPAETRHDLVAIVSTFDAALQRISAPAGEASEFTAADLAPLYATLPVLDARVEASNAETRLAAQNKTQFWAMLLTLVSWCSLIIAAACAAGIYLTLRDKHSAPMRALAQSIQNMARGDMRTAIWGIERQDMIGELARAVDIARYHFSHLPDLSLLSEQGPVRMRFEGGSRSLFEAMMKAISRDSENIRAQAGTLAEAVRNQKDSVALLSEKVEMVLQNILQRGQTGDQQIKQTIHDMVASAEGLKNAHAHAADQLNRMIPFMQERVQGMSEIAQITGKQVAHTLNSLSQSEMHLKTNAEQARTTLAKLSSTADDLGERMFGAINLLQASGKVLVETTESVQAKLSEPLPPITIDSSTMRPLAQRLDQMVEQLGDIKQRNHEAATASSAAQIISGIEQLLTKHIELKLAALEHTIKLQKQDLLAHSEVLSAQNGDAYRQILDGALNPKLAALEWAIEQQAKTITHNLTAQTILAADQSKESLRDISEKLAALSQAMPTGLQQRMQDQWYQLVAQIESARSSIENAFENKIVGKITSFEQTLQAMQGTIEKAKHAIENPISATVTLPPELQRQMKDQSFQIAAQIEATRAGLTEAIARQIEQMEARLSAKQSGKSLSQTAADYGSQRQMEQQTQILTELVATLGILDAHMQQIKSEIHSKAI